MELAARRGDKGFSRIVQEAVELYLAHHAARADAIAKAVALKGSLADDEGEALSSAVREARENWR